MYKFLLSFFATFLIEINPLVMKFVLNLD